MEEKSRKTILEERKSIVHMPKEEQFPWALLTGAYMLFFTALLVLMQGLAQTDVMTQVIMFASAVVVFALGGYYLHCYHRWMLRTMTR
jgi:hypothetical protein